MKGKFQIKAIEESIITEKGLRAFVMERILNSPLERGMAVNVDKKTVEVRLQGDEKEIQKFIEELKEEVIAEFGNPVITFTIFTEDLKLEIPEVMRSSQGLMLGQLSKGINVQLKILNVLENSVRETRTVSQGTKNLSGEIKGMSGEIKDMSGEIKSMSGEIKNVSVEMKNMSNGINRLPEELAKMLKTS